MNSDIVKESESTSIFSLKTVPVTDLCNGKILTEISPLWAKHEQYVCMNKSLDFFFSLEDLPKAGPMHGAALPEQ